MKKFITMVTAIAAICIVILLLVCGRTDASVHEPTIADVAAVWFQENHENKTYDEIFIKGYVDLIPNTRLTTIEFYNEGKLVVGANINLDWYRELYFG